MISSLPVHTTQFFDLVDTELKPQLSNPLHLAELEVIRPRRYRKRPYFFTLNSGLLVGILAKLGIEIF